MLSGRKAYSLVEILFVVMIVGILASISTPMFLESRLKAMASEGVAGMALVRQAMRDYWITSNNYYDVGVGNILNALPTSVASGIPTPNNAGVDVDLNVVQYFSNGAFSIDATTPASPRFSAPPVVDFLIIVNGGASVACSALVTTNCAINAAAVSDIDIEMDNSGRIAVSYDNGTSWRTY